MMQKRKIGFLNTGFPSSSLFPQTLPSSAGGDGKSLLDLISHMNKDKYDFTILSLGNKKLVQQESPQTGLNLFRYPSFGTILNNNKIFSRIIPPNMIFDIDKFSFDLIHCHYGYPGCELPALYCKNKNKIPLLLSIRASQNPNWGSIRRRILKKTQLNTTFLMILEESDVIIIPTKGFLKDFPKLKKYRDKIHVVPNGVDIEIFSRYNNHENLEIKTKDGIPKHEKILLFVGSLVEGKGIKTLLNSFEKVIKKYPDTGLVIVGKGPQEKNIRKRAKNSGYLDKLYMTGYIDNSNRLAKIYSFSDLFVFPSKAETFGRVVLESMAAGTPCLVSDIGVLMDVIDQGSVGLYGEVNNPISFASKILDFFEMNEIERKSMENKVVEYAKGYSWGDVARQMEEIYDELLE